MGAAQLSDKEHSEAPFSFSITKLITCQLLRSGGGVFWGWGTMQVPHLTRGHVFPSGGQAGGGMRMARLEKNDVPVLTSSAKAVAHFNIRGRSTPLSEGERETERHSGWGVSGKKDALSAVVLFSIKARESSLRSSPDCDLSLGGGGGRGGS